MAGQIIIYIIYKTAWPDRAALLETKVCILCSHKLHVYFPNGEVTELAFLKQSSFEWSYFVLMHVLGKQRDGSVTVSVATPVTMQP